MLRLEVSPLTNILRELDEQNFNAGKMYEDREEGEFGSLNFFFGLLNWGQRYL
jgi:hypothetical protein